MTSAVRWTESLALAEPFNPYLFRWPADGKTVSAANSLAAQFTLRYDLDMDSSNTALHPFERAGLGKAPFKFAGLRDTGASRDEMGLVQIGTMDGYAVSTKPGGTCAFCGQYIVVMVDVVSADGQKFHVGTDCAEKTCGPKLVAAVEAAVRKRNRAKRADKAANVQVELGILFADEEAQTRLAALPHPSIAGRSMADYAEWMIRRAGATGRAKLLKTLKAALAA